jgi:hypothetical protein
MTARETAKPIEARTLEQICKLRYDNIEGLTSWLLVGEDEVWIHNQRFGKKSTGEVTIPRNEFDRMVHWYTTGELKRKSAAKRPSSP